MKKLSIIISTFFLCSLTCSLAQTRLANLLKEREDLYKQYEHYNSQNSSLFGKKSKKDLNNIVQTLKEIVAKDNQIIQEVRMMSTQQVSNYVGQNREVTTRLYDLTDEVDKLNAQLKLRKAELTTQQENLKMAEDQMHFLYIALGVLVLVLIFLAFYIIKLKSTVATQKS